MNEIGLLISLLWAVFFCGFVAGKLHYRREMIRKGWHGLYPTQELRE